MSRICLLPIELLKYISSYVELKDHFSFLRITANIHSNTHYQRVNRIQTICLRTKTEKWNWYQLRDYMILWNVILQDMNSVLNNPTWNNNAFIKMAAANNHTHLVNVLLSYSQCDPSTADNYPIRIASENGHLEMVKLLISDPRCDPSDRDNYSIWMASINGHLEIVKLLISDPRCDPSARDNYSIRMAKMDI